MKIIFKLLAFAIGWLVGIALVAIYMDSQQLGRMPAIGNIVGMVLGGIFWLLMGRMQRPN